MQDQIQSYLTFLAEEDEASENTVAAYRNDLEPALHVSQPLFVADGRADQHLG